MDQRVRAGQGGRDRGRIRQVVRDERQAGRCRQPRARRVAHEREHLVPAGEEPADDRATDEPPAAGDRDAHQ